MGHSPWGHKESDTTEQLTHTHTHTHANHREIVSHMRGNIDSCLNLKRKFFSHTGPEPQDGTHSHGAALTRLSACPVPCGTFSGERGNPRLSEVS